MSIAKGRLGNEGEMKATKSTRFSNREATVYLKKQREEEKPAVSA